MLTDNEIKKALKEILELMCIEGDLQRSATISNALNLINRLQAENERLRANNKVTMQTIADVHTEAIKEFAERLKTKAMATYKTLDNEYRYEFDNVFIDNLLKELVGDTDA